MRVGKTTLLRRFSQLSETAAGEGFAPVFTYPDWEAALRALISLARKRRFVVVIDEFPRYAVYALNVTPGLRALGEQERNVHLFTPADVIGDEGRANS